MKGNDILKVLPIARKMLTMFSKQVNRPAPVSELISKGFSGLFNLQLVDFFLEP